MGFQFPMLNDNILEQFANACRVVCLSGNGDARTQVREAVLSAPSLQRDFTSLRDDRDRFRTFGYQVAGQPVTILGTWFAGSRAEADIIADKIKSAVMLNDKQKMAGQLAGRVVFLAASADATKRVTGLRIIADTEATFALVNTDGMNGQKVIQTRVRNGAEIANISGIANELATSTQILTVRPSVPFAHALEHSLGLCGVAHGR